jgi:PPOX class probable F420-dependent enzyme
VSPLPDDVRAVLAGRAFAHLATVMPDGAPHSSPVWIDVEPDGRLVMFTQSVNRKARNIARDPRVAVSATAEDDPYRQVDLRGRVVERIEGDDAQAVADRLSVKYTGAAFPWRSPNTIALRIAVDATHHVKLPFEHA